MTLTKNCHCVINIFQSLKLKPMGIRHLSLSFCAEKLTNGISTHYNDIIMSVMASQITSFTIVYSTIYAGTDQRKYQSSVSLAFVRGIHWWLVNSPHKGSNTENVSIWLRHHDRCQSCTISLLHIASKIICFFIHIISLKCAYFGCCSVQTGSYISPNQFHLEMKGLGLDFKRTLTNSTNALFNCSAYINHSQCVPMFLLCNCGLKLEMSGGLVKKKRCHFDKKMLS